MKESIVEQGKILPESAEEFGTYKLLLKYTHCVDCGQIFSEANVLSVPGWRETQISGTCEACFNRMFGIES